MNLAYTSFFSFFGWVLESAKTTIHCLRSLHVTSGVNNLELERAESEEWLAYCQMCLQGPTFSRVLKSQNQ